MKQYELDLWLKHHIPNFPTYKISIEYRDDILLREHIIKNKDEKNWNQFLANQIKYKLTSSRPYQDFILLFEDIEKYGIKEPLEIDFYEGEYIIIDGAHRLAIVRVLGIEKIPVVLTKHAGHNIVQPIYHIPSKDGYYKNSNRRVKVFENIDLNIFKGL